MHLLPNSVATQMGFYDKCFHTMHLLPNSVATQMGLYDKWFYLLWTDNVEVSCIMISDFSFSSVLS
jgi:hypothetical protein